MSAIVRTAPAHPYPHRRVMAAWLMSALVLAVFTTSAAGQTGTPSAPQNGTGRAPAPGRLFLWRVASPTAIVHLLGSVHIASSSMYPLDARVEDAFARARTLVLELPVDAAAQLDAAQKLGRAGAYPPGDALDLHLSRDLLESLQAHLAKSGAPFDAVRPFRPWFVSMILTLGEMQQLGYTVQQGIDHYFAGRLRPPQRLEALETVDEQVEPFRSISEPVQQQMLKEALGNLPGLQAQMERAARLWRAGEAEALDALWLKPLRLDFPDLYREVFVKRNQRMAAAVERYLRSSGEYFVVLGSGHLIGPDGIVALLTARGFAPVQQ
jgi:uncharacterized protein